MKMKDKLRIAGTMFAIGAIGFYISCYFHYTDGGQWVSDILLGGGMLCLSIGIFMKASKTEE